MAGSTYACVLSNRKVHQGMSQPAAQRTSRQLTCLATSHALLTSSGLSIGHCDMSSSGGVSHSASCVPLKKSPSHGKLHWDCTEQASEA